MLTNIAHTRNTKVGDDFVRGVSGGERKRVSIAEMALAGTLAHLFHIICLLTCIEVLPLLLGIILQEVSTHKLLLNLSGPFELPPTLVV